MSPWCYVHEYQWEITRFDDCPYCTIGRLRTQLAEYEKTIALLEKGNKNLNEAVDRLNSRIVLMNRCIQPSGCGHFNSCSTCPVMKGGAAPPAAIICEVMGTEVSERTCQRCIPQHHSSADHCSRWEKPAAPAPRPDTRGIDATGATRSNWPPKTAPAAPNIPEEPTDADWEDFYKHPAKYGVIAAVPAPVAPAPRPDTRGIDATGATRSNWPPKTAPAAPNAPNPRHGIPAQAEAPRGELDVPVAGVPARDGKADCSTCASGPRVKGEVIDSCKKYAMADQCYDFGFSGYEKRKGGDEK